VDAIFTKVAGWSLRERAATLSKEELMQTQYAQPYTFMVQVGLTELIKSFNLRVTIVSVVAERKQS
jgi:acyl transferase domain-containing protein